MIDFAVVGLPRSGTTWLANWLTTDRSLCLHDPFAQGLPENWPIDERRRGISCTGAYVLGDWLDRQECPVAVIQRPLHECNQSLSRMGWPHVSHLRRLLNKTEGRRWQYADLWNEEKARDLWAFLLPSIPFDALRYRQLRLMQVQPYMPRWSMVEGVLEEMTRRGFAPPGEV